MKLFVFYVGGSVPGSHLELHDMRFAFGETAEACWDDLRAQWWGTPESLHLDAWGPLEQADGFDITLTANPPDAQRRLWFVHLGGYDPAQFTELHHNAFIVADDAKAAKKRALTSTKSWVSPHKDAILDVDEAIDVSGLAKDRGLFLSLSLAQVQKPFTFEAAYVPIGKMADR